ncbi:MAG: AraC family transcriptional regulator [Acutalibacteraceae bacterium]|nr:AraC family transcriptional regulator [Acutalibacteraceae bacterium]
MKHIGRMLFVKKQMKTVEPPVREIGRQVGYPDQLHFSRAFKSIYGLSPRNWKKEIQNL